MLKTGWLDIGHWTFCWFWIIQKQSIIYILYIIYRLWILYNITSHFSSSYIEKWPKRPTSNVQSSILLFHKNLLPSFNIDTGLQLIGVHPIAHEVVDGVIILQVVFHRFDACRDNCRTEGEIIFSYYQITPDKMTSRGGSPSDSLGSNINYSSNYLELSFFILIFANKYIMLNPKNYNKWTIDYNHYFSFYYSFWCWFQREPLP